MSQSESEAEYAPAEDKPIFPYQRLYYDAEDEARIQAKPEIERERILAERSEQVERHEQDLTLRRLVEARNKEQAKTTAKNKRKAGVAELEESQRKSSRQRTKLGGGRVGEASSAIEAYKQQRAEKSLRDEQRRREAATRAARTPEANDLSDQEGEVSEDDYDADRRRTTHFSPTPPKDDPVADLVDVQRAKVGRDNFAQVCYHPGFEETITNCYARVCLGPGNTPGVNEYRLCLVKGFTTGKPYAMVGANGRPFPVNKYIIAAHGKAEKSWSFLECSMGKFTDAEWRRYKIVMANEDCKIPKRSFINAKLDQINKLINHKFTHHEIDEKMRAQNDLLDTIFRTKEKEEIKEKLRAARHADEDESVIAELEDQLAAIRPMKLALNTTLERPGSNYINKEAEKLAELNRRNERLSSENVRKAELAALHARKVRKHLLTPAVGVDELFEGGSDISRTGTPVNGGTGTPLRGLTPGRGTPVPGAAAAGAGGTASGANTPIPRSGTPNPNPIILKPVAKKGIPVIRKAAYDDEILANMDLGIEIEL